MQSAPLPAPPRSRSASPRSLPANAKTAPPLDYLPVPKLAPYRKCEYRRGKRSSFLRARSVPLKSPYIAAIGISALFYLALIGAAATFFTSLVEQSRGAALLFIGFVASSAFLWFLSFLQRRNCLCSLCRGTPYVDSAACRHERAIRFFPLNYGTSNVICSLLSQHFRCQYCGNTFDLLKPTKEGTPHSPRPTSPPGPTAVSK